MARRTSKRSSKRQNPTPAVPPKTAQAVDASSWRTAWPLALAVALAVLAFTLSYFWNEDFWWYLASGEVILEQGGIPSDDPFLYPEENRGQWITHSWLWTVLVRLVYGASGLYGSVVLSSLIALALAGLVFTAGRVDRFGFVNATLAAAALLTLNHRLALKAELASWLLILVFFRLLDRQRPFTWRVGVTLVALQWLWSNLHGGYPLGIGAVAAYSLAGWWRRRRGQDATSAPPIGWLPILALISLAMPGLAEARLRVVSSLLGLRGAVEGLPDTLLLEWQTTFAGPWDLYAWSYAIFAVVVLLSFPISRSPHRLARLLLCAGMAVVGFKAVRFVPGFVLVSSAVTLANLNAFAPSIPRLPAKLRLAYPIFCGLLALSLMLTAFSVRTARHDFNAGQATGLPVVTSPLSTSPGAIDFLRRHRLPEPIMNDMMLGGNLIHELYPDYRFFTDNRNLSDKLLREYSQFLSSQDHWRRAEQRHGFRTVILTTIFTRGLLRDLLAADSRWRLVYLDPTAVIFTRIDFSTPTPELHPWRVPAPSQDDQEIVKTVPFLAQSDPLRQLAYRIVRYDPEDLLVTYLQTLGGVQRVQDLEALATDTLEQRHIADVQWMRATARLYRGDLEGSREDMRSAIEQGFTNVEARLQYAALLMRLRRPEDALRQLEAAEQDAPRHPQVLQLRRQIQGLMNR